MRKLIEEIYEMYLDSVGGVRNEELEGAVADKEEALRSLITDKGIEAFEAYDTARDNLERSYNTDDFVTGFRMGARLMLEILHDDPGKATKNSEDI